MKLLNHVLNIRSLIQQAISNRFDRLGITDDPVAPVPTLTGADQELRNRLKEIVEYHANNNVSYEKARQMAINECTFTLFNRMAALKVMEDKDFFPEVIRRRPEHGGKSAAHNEWLEEHPEGRSLEREGLLEFFKDRFNEEAKTFPIFSESHPYSIMPRADEFNEIIDAFNAVSEDSECGADIWRGDDILGWLYENFNAIEKQEHKDSGEKTEYDKVSLQSQVYTPQWVVKFLVDNTVGKMYLEMFPESQIDHETDPETGKIKYRIANRPKEQTRKPKNLKEWKIIDPACGSGNFLIYTFSLLYDLYLDRIENFGAEYSKKDIPAMIIENNLYGVDLDERAVQLSQIALRIKARELGGKRARTAKHTNIVSTNFHLPSFSDSGLEEELKAWDINRTKLVEKIWQNLGDARKFGSLIRVDEDVKAFEEAEINQLRQSLDDIFADQYEDSVFSFSQTAITVLRNKFKERVDTDKYSQTKFEDAIKFLEIVNKKYDVAVANPPYTDSGDFGSELKTYIGKNYKKTYNTTSNLYSVFIRRCIELVNETGDVGMVTPSTFMFIKQFEQTRYLILNECRINLFVHWGFLGMFSPNVRIRTAAFVLEKQRISSKSIFFKLDEIGDRYRKEVFFNSYKRYITNGTAPHMYSIDQSILSKIKSSPFIYWISANFRKTFEEYSLSNTVSVISGFKTGNNEGALRHWWEVLDKNKWKAYTKGGGANRWYGNIWLKVNTFNNFEFLKSQRSYNIPSILNKCGITYSGSGADDKGVSFRLLEMDTYYDMGSCALFPNNPLLYLAILNSKLISYSSFCLNPTPNKQPNDINRLPLVDLELFGKKSRESLVGLSIINVNIKKQLCKFSLIEPLFEQSPIQPGNLNAKESVATYYVYENGLLTQVLLNEAIINREVFDIYELSVKDRKMVLDKEGIPVGDLPVSEIAKSNYFQWLHLNKEFPASEELNSHINSLPISEVQPSLDFDRLYQKNYDWEEFCIQNNVNPIEAWYQFSVAQTLPAQRTQVLAFELITDVIRTLLEKDDDGVMPLVDRTGEGLVADCIQQEMIQRGYTASQISQVVSLLAMPLDRYLRDKFFQQLSDHLNLFMYLPKTPFIWHLTSGPLHAMELYVSIYKWNRNTLSRVKSVYCANRESALRDRLATLSQSNDSAAQSEAADIRAQLRELSEFVAKLDALLASNYDPKLDDGVGKNIAPLQKAGLLSYAVLKETGGKKSQLYKFLNADW